MNWQSPLSLLVGFIVVVIIVAFGVYVVQHLL